MKKTFALLATVLITATISAQVPDKMSYQAVIRDSEGKLIMEQEVGMKISILQSTADGFEVYTESQTPTTNKNGLVSIAIGGEAGFADIDWSGGPYFILTETDPTGGTNYTITGTSQLLSVPYALHAKTAETLAEAIVESDPVFTGSPAAFVTDSDLISWYEAYSWGDHALEDYLTEEEDPVFTTWDKSTGIAITESQITDLQDYITAITGESIGDLADVDLTGIAVGKILKYDNTEEKWVIAEEEDPIFEAWDKSEGIVITESQISDLQEYLTEETDPSVPTGTTPGEMQYWNGSAWITVAVGNEDQVLTFVGGIPIWKTQGEVENPTTGKIWMDRNLGALRVAGSSTDADAYGDLYQWGRAGDGHQLRTSGTTATLSTTDTPGHGNFILNGSSPYDWRSTQNVNLWQGVSGTNNPCPSGYRLPTEAEWNAERLSWGSNNSAGAFASPLKLPVAGYRDFSDGSLYDVGSGGVYWSSTVDATRSRTLYFASSTAFMYSDSRAFGSSVRCFKD